MDNSSFAKILDFRNKIPPSPLLLRLKDWFTRYDFTVRHVKGHHNIIADMLSRPPLTHLITPTCHYPLIFMTSPASPSSSPPDIPDYSFPPELMATLPPNHQPSLDQIQTFAKLPLYAVYRYSIGLTDTTPTNGSYGQLTLVMNGTPLMIIQGCTLTISKSHCSIFSVMLITSPPTKFSSFLISLETPLRAGTLFKIPT
ncbi:hypothetical protein LWI29_017607 [Acer saccharum]|uniref:Uncharacterized protein n=1 Tax=Acer saccharum TaxID=4024 RepID=A0AA39VZB9_ACESA|nr:hypothetical protein LWI29_017607 [Acer saccharum]